MSLSMPAEWAEHTGCLMAWPSRPDLWGDLLPQAREEYAEVAAAIAEFEPVTMIANPGHAAAARDLCGDTVAVIELDIDDAWFRDSGPIFITGPDGQLAGADFRFNSWGSKHTRGLRTMLSPASCWPGSASIGCTRTWCSRVAPSRWTARAP